MSTNRMSELRAFLVSWDAPAPPHPQKAVPVVEGNEGQINLGGTSDSPAVIVTRHYPEFESLIEGRIKNLVVFLIKAFDCITYSSCAGHASPDGQDLVCGANVGVLPRDEIEYSHLRDWFAAAINEVDQSNRAVTLELDETMLESEELSMPCLDINFRPNTSDADYYFADLETTIERLMDQLDVQRALGVAG